MSYLILILLMLALALTQALAGGRQLALCLPGYGILAAAALLSWWPARRTPIPRAAGECLLTAAIFFTYITVRALYSPEEYLARRDLYLALGAMAAYLLVTLSMPSAKTQMWLVMGLLALGLANCAVGAIQFFKGQNYMIFDFLPRPEYGTRASGFFGYPNHLATFLGVTLMLGLAVTFCSRWPVWTKMLTGYASLMCLLGILITGSRGGYIATAIGLLVFALLCLILIGKLAAGRAIALIVAGSLMVGTLGLGIQHLQSRSFLIQSRTTETLTKDLSRLRLWQAAWKQFKLQPVVGTGSGTYLYYGRQFRHPAIQKDPVYAHNEYLQLLAEYGILGIAAAVMLLETHLRRGWNSLLASVSNETSTSAPDRNAIALTVGGLSAAAVSVSHAFMDYSLHMPASLLVVACVFGMLASLQTTDGTAEEESAPDWSPYFRLGLPLLGLWIGARALPTLPAEFHAEKARTALADWKLIVSPEVPKAVEGLAQRGLAIDPRNPEFHFFIGEAKAALAIQATDPAQKIALQEEALAAYEKALALAPQDVRLLLSKAQSLDALQRFGESGGVLARVMTLDPLSGGVRFAYATHLHAAGQLAEAGTEYQRALQLGFWPAAQNGLDRLKEEVKADPGKLRPPIPENQ